ncbi:tail assembly chaperone [Mycobacterium phage Phrappuccino]|uniref:Tail assembly chaperone n=1 Tax=Mycobacterium phage Phrappuccino TaxID=2591223 RepID=A0A514DDQ6_9CAUD|nr:tail assembly chaperone [Mycobacterium phage Phrappuccino]QDH91751.1 tail assembly chaperone [Mycobacterium phage Phrappuccino]QIQ63193.1 tail assembly chaperone [Mycobacterium phage Settecandela]
MTSVPEPNLGPPPTLATPGIQPPTQFVPAQPFSEDEFDPMAVAPPPEPEEVEEEEVTELDDDELRLFASLLTVGQIFKTISVMGHKVKIQSLRVADDLRIGLYCRPHEGSKMEQRAYQLAVCAAGIVEVNGQPLVNSFLPMTDDERFDKQAEILKNAYPVMLTRVHRAIMALDQEFVELADKLGKLEG